MPQHPTPPGLTLALSLAAVGWHVFPLSPRDKRPLGNCPRCRQSAGKPPHTAPHCPCLTAGRWCHGVRAATLDPARLTAWWTTEPRAVPGVATGPSGLCLIDIDTGHEPLPANPATHLLPGIDLTAEPIPAQAWNNPARFRDGRDSLSLLAALRGLSNPWPSGDHHRPVVAATPSGGCHLWYRTPAANLHQVIAKTSGTRPCGLAWQVDIKAGWSYGIAPGATAATGRYRHLSGDPAHVGTMPDWFGREVIRVASSTPPIWLTSPVPTLRPTTSADRASAYIEAVLANGLRNLAGLHDGRKTALAALAYHLGGLTADADLDWAKVQSALIDAGISTGLTPAIAARTVARSIANGRSRPLSIPISRAHTGGSHAAR